MIAWASNPRVRVPYFTDTSDANYYDATDSSTATCTGASGEYYIVSSSGAVDLVPLLEAIKRLRPPQVHERQMKPLPAREYVIPYNRKMLMQQFKQSRR